MVNSKMVDHLGILGSFSVWLWLAKRLAKWLHSQGWITGCSVYSRFKSDLEYSLIYFIHQKISTNMLFACGLCIWSGLNTIFVSLWKIRLIKHSRKPQFLGLVIKIRLELRPRKCIHLYLTLKWMERLGFMLDFYYDSLIFKEL